MEILKWLAVGVFGIIVIVVIAGVAMPVLQSAGNSMITEIQTQVNELISLN